MAGDFHNDLVIKGAEDRGEKVSPIMPQANWVSLAGNFTPEELRAIADRVDSAFAGRTLYGDQD